MDARARDLAEAVGELALAIKPHNMDSNQREKIRIAMGVLIDEIIAKFEDETKQIRKDFAAAQIVLNPIADSSAREDL